LTKSRIAEKSAVVQQNAHVAELEYTNAQLLVELNAARSRLAEVEHHEQALTSDYEGLCRYFDDLRTSHDATMKEKADLKKTEHEKAQRFPNSLRKKLAELRVDMEATVTALGAMHGFSLYQHCCHRFFGVVSDGGPGCTHCLF
jgi:chromosome segregation ATPase